MAQRPPTIACENVPLDEARSSCGGPRMNPELYYTLKQNIQSLDNAATHMPLLEGTSPTTMKNRILRVAAELSISVRVRKVPGGLLRWRSTDEDLQQATEVVAQLQSTRQPPQATRRGRRRRG